MAAYPSMLQEKVQQKQQKWAPQEQYYPQQPAPNFPSLPCPLGLNAEYVAVRPEVLVMQERFSWGGDKFRVATSDGQEILSMAAKKISFSQRKRTFFALPTFSQSLFPLPEFFSPSGDLLFVLRQRLFEIPMSLYIENGSGAEVCAIDGNWSFGTKFDVRFVNILGGGQPVELAVRGDWIDRRAEITWNGMPIAKVRRQFANLRELSGRSTYGVEVVPGVDMSLVSLQVLGGDGRRF